MIETIKTEAEISQCAEIMISSEPWLRLGTTFAEAVATLKDPDNHTYIANTKEGPAGFVTITLKGSLPGYIKRIAVKEEYRSTHIGEKLMQFAEELIFPITKNVFLCVSDFNYGAVRFYNRLGYEKIGEIKDYISPGSSEIIMRKTKGPLKM